MQAEIATLREQLETAIRQRDQHLAKREEAEQTPSQLLPNEEEMADSTLWATSADIQRIISDTETR